MIPDAVWKVEDNSKAARSHRYHSPAENSMQILHRGCRSWFLFLCSRGCFGKMSLFFFCVGISTCFDPWSDGGEEVKRLSLNQTAAVLILQPLANQILQG